MKYKADLFCFLLNISSPHTFYFPTNGFLCYSFGWMDRAGFEVHLVN